MKSAEVKFSIPKPCHVPVSSMSRNEKSYYCSVCTKNVYDFSSSSRQEIMNKLLSGETACGIIPVQFLTKTQPRSYLSHSFLIAVISFILLLINPRQAFSQKKKEVDHRISFEKTDSNNTIIAGKIIEKATKQPVEFANVEIHYKGITRALTQTNIGGSYSIDLTGKIDSGFVDILVSYAGHSYLFKDINLQSGKLTRLDISMTIDPASVTMGIIIREPVKTGSDKTIRGKELERMRYSD